MTPSPSLGGEPNHPQVEGGAEGQIIPNKRPLFNFS